MESFKQQMKSSELTYTELPIPIVLWERRNITEKQKNQQRR